MHKSLPDTPEHDVSHDASADHNSTDHNSADNNEPNRNIDTVSLKDETVEAAPQTNSLHTNDEVLKPAHVTTGNSLTPRSRLNKTPKLIANGSHAVRWYGLSLLLLIIDQWTKWLAETKLIFHDPVPVIEPILNWTLAYNYGAAFSFLADAGGWQKWFFSGLALIMSVFLIGYLIKAPRQAKLLSLGLALVLGGAVGNLIDRLLHGHVIDFIHVHYADAWHYPIFNIADMGISIGVALIIIDMLFLEKKRHS